MSVVDVKEDWSARTVEEEPGRIIAVRVFTVLFDEEDDPAARPLLARSAPGIPRPWASHPYHRWMTVQAKHVETISPILYKVTVTYKAETKSKIGRDDTPVSPLAMPPEENWYFATTNEPIDRDIEGNPLTNSAGESFDPPLTREFHDLVGRIIKNQVAYNPVMAYEYIGSINSDSFRGFPPETVLCRVFTGDEVYTPYMKYYRVTYEFQVRFDGWKRRVLDQGFREYVGTGTDGAPLYKQFTDNEGNPLTEPTLLNGNGKKLDDGASAVFLEFDVRRKLPFSKLGLG